MTEDRFNPFFSQEVAPAHTEHWQAKRRVADAIRQLTEVLVTSIPDIADLHGIAETLEETAVRFARTRRIYGRIAFADDGSQGDYGEVFHEMSPLSGQGNPLAPPLNMWMDAERAYGKATLGWSYEGPPGCVHGGYVAALFDDFMGMAQSLGEQPGMTGTLSIRYLRPTPLHTELQLEAWLVGSEGRKTTVHAEMRAGDIVTATCDALFIRPLQDVELLRDAVRAQNRSPS